MHRSSLPCLLLLVTLAITLPGCQKSLGVAGLGQAAQAYSTGQYPQAYQTAARVANDGKLSPQQRAEAALIAGMAAEQMGNPRAAQGYLLQATQSSDLSVKGDAFASLGLSYAKEERFVQAAQAMLRAAEFLHGPEKANAYYHAAASQQKLGQFAQARTSLFLAKAANPEPGFVAQVDGLLATTGYTLQLGAFRDEGNARKAAEQFAQRTAGAQLGSPRIVPAQDPRGGQLQLVQVGQFSTFATARAAKDRLGERDAIIVPLP